MFLKMIKKIFTIRRKSKSQRLKQVLFMVVVGSMMYAVSMHMFEDHNDQQYLWAEIMELPEDLRKEYQKNEDGGIIRLKKDLPFDDSCLKSLGRNSLNNITDYNKQDLLNKDIKKIMVWHTAFNNEDMNFGVGREGFTKSCCKESRCFITSDRQLIPITKYDAVIMQYRGLIPQDLPKERTKRQRWIFLEMESGSYMYEDPTIYRNFFNWTMSFRRDSDIFSRYGQVIHKSLIPNWKMENQVTDRNFASTKTKLVAWFVSNCQSISYREKYVKNLGKYLPIDIFGLCGRKQCSRKNEIECYQMLSKSYKFYLSFENSLCRDYVTEKLFNILKYDVVPVVYGFADYKIIAPPHSYINALNYNCSGALTKYLLYLDQNDTAYNEYFKWKLQYQVYTDEQAIPFNMCELCYKLHNDNTTKVYKDIGNWFREKGYCRRIIPVSWLEWALQKININVFPGCANKQIFIFF